MYGGIWNTLHWLGAVVAVVALAGAIAARVQLGGAFSVGAAPRGLVTKGIYARIRHPMFIGASLLILGLGLFLRDPYLLGVLLIVVPVQFLRARKEDRLLEERFGAAYIEYRKHTWL